MKNDKTAKKIRRRSFLKRAAAASAVSTFTIIPAHAAPRTDASAERDQLPPSEKVRLAAVGTSARGGAILGGLASTGLAEVTALCDVDTSRTAGARAKYPKAAVFQDFRVMLDKVAGRIDAVSVGVPDHAHFPIAMLAMSLGKHVYVEKPLAHTFEECELLMAAEEKYKVSGQMGNQGHSGANFFQFKAWVDAGIIKNVRRVDAFMNNPRRWHGWTITGFPPAEPKPETMDWDLWVGAAPYHEYSRKFDPGNWRSWYDYGNGAFGDWGPHTLDTCHRFLKLGLPTKIVAERLDGPNDYIFPQATTIGFHFPERGEGMPACKVTWYDGVKNLPPKPPEMGGDKPLRGCGKVIYSDDLVFKGGTHSATLGIIPSEKAKEMASKLPEVPESPSNHFENFLLAAKGEEKPRSSFDVSGPLTQVFLLGVIAQRLGGTLEFDPKTKQITNNDRANQLLAGPPPRKGWESYYQL